MEINKIYQESCLDTLSKMPDNYLDCVITSPPYYQLRDYGYPEQWGLEPTFQEYLEHLWSMMDLIWLKLKDTGTVWINLGDTYFGGGGGNYSSDSTMDDRHENSVHTQPKWVNQNIPSKCLLLIPHRFAIGCIERGWILRNDCIWAKTNGMPESVTDRFSKKHEFIFFFVKSQKYYFDLDAVREKHKQSSIDRSYRAVSDTNKWILGADGQTPHGLSQPRPHTTKIPEEQAELFGSPRVRQHRNKIAELDYNKHIGVSDKTTLTSTHENGKNPGDVSDFWDIPTKPNKEKHYAIYNDSLLKKPVLAGCPENGIIYDPFMGTGSTAEVAIRAGRNYIGSEMKPEYCQIAEKRLRPFKEQLKLF